jgi:tetratricopeptide (TPR) repeat protein
MSSNSVDIIPTLLKAAEVFREKGHWMKAMETLQNVVILMGERHAMLHVAESHLGEVMHNLFMNDQAVRMLIKALIKRIHQYGENSDLARSTMATLGTVYLAMQKYDKAHDMFQRAYRSWQASLNKCPVELMHCMCYTGDWHRAQRQYEMAVSFYRTALNVAFHNYTQCEIIDGQCATATHTVALHLAIVRAYNSLSFVYTDMNNHPDAIQSYFLAADVVNRCTGIRKDHVCTLYSSLSLSLMMIGELDKARRYGEWAFNISATFHCKTGCEYGRICNNLATVYMKRAQFEDAIAMETNAIEAYESSCGDRHPMIGVCYNNIGVAYRALGRHKASVEVTELAEKQLGQTAGYESRSYIVVLYNLGGCYLELRKNNVGMQLLERALDNAEKVLGKWNEDTVAIATSLHVAYEKNNRKQDADLLQKKYDEINV